MENLHQYVKSSSKYIIGLMCVSRSFCMLKRSDYSSSIFLFSRCVEKNIYLGQKPNILLTETAGRSLEGKHLSIS